MSISSNTNPMFLQQVLDFVPSEIKRLSPKKFEVKIDVLTELRFELSCDDVHWQCSWNALTGNTEIFESGKLIKLYNSTNNSAHTTSRCLVEDIHREKLMRTNPKDIKEFLNGLPDIVQ